MKSQQMIYTQVPNTTDGRCTFASLPCGPHKTSHSEIQRGRKKKKCQASVRAWRNFPKGGNHPLGCTRAGQPSLQISLKARTATSQNAGEEAGLAAPRGLGVGKANGEEKKTFTKQIAFRGEGLAHAHTHGFSVQVESLFAGGSEKSLSEQGLGRVVGQLEVVGARVDRWEGAVRGVHLAHHGEPRVEVGEAAGR